MGAGRQDGGEGDVQGDRRSLPGAGVPCARQAAARRQCTRARRTAMKKFVLAALFAVAACDGRPQSKSSTPKDPLTGPKVVVFDLSQGVPEQEESSLLGPPSQGRTIVTLLKRIA